MLVYQKRRTSLFVAGLIAIGQLTGIEVGWCIAEGQWSVTRRAARQEVFKVFRS